MKTLKRIEAALGEKFELDDPQEETILASDFMIISIPFDERIDHCVTLKEIEAWMDEKGFDQDLLYEYDKESGEHTDYVKLVFREDNEESVNRWIDQNGDIGDYEEVIHQERWF